MSSKSHKRYVVVREPGGDVLGRRGSGYLNWQRNQEDATLWATLAGAKAQATNWARSLAPYQAISIREATVQLGEVVELRPA